MSFKDKHALDTLPKIIAALQAEVDALKTKLDDPGFYARDRAAFEKTTVDARQAPAAILLRPRSNGLSLRSCVKNLPALKKPPGLERNHRNCHIRPP